MHESEKGKWSHSVVSDSYDPMDCSLPGSSAHGIFQARVLEWGAIAFSTWPLRDAQSTAPRAMLSCCLFSSEAHVPQRTEPAATTVGG